MIKMTKIKNVPLEEILNISKKIKGEKLYKVTWKDRSVFEDDKLVECLLDCGSILYSSQKEFDYYDYELSENVFFDEDKHPHWEALYGEDSFKLYDGYFLGHYGCGGNEKYLRIIGQARNDLIDTKDEEVLEKYKEFLERYSSVKKEIFAGGLRAKFGLGHAEINEEFSDYLRYEDDEDPPHEKEIRIFWTWFENNFIDEKEYERKMVEVTKKEQKRAFTRNLRRTTKQLAKLGFKKTA